MQLHAPASGRHQPEEHHRSGLLSSVAVLALVAAGSAKAQVVIGGGYSPGYYGGYAPYPHGGTGITVGISGISIGTYPAYPGYGYGLGYGGYDSYYGGGYRGYYGGYRGGYRGGWRR